MIEPKTQDIFSVLKIFVAGRGGSQGQEMETILVNMVKPHLY